MEVRFQTVAIQDAAANPASANLANFLERDGCPYSEGWPHYPRDCDGLGAFAVAKRPELHQLHRLRISTFSS